MIKKYNAINILVWFVLILTPFLLQENGVISTMDWKISKANGLLSIITGSFLHGSYSHMTGNLSGLLVGVAVLYNFYSKMYWQVILLGIILPSALMYYLGTPSVGISGLVYALLWFILVRGLMSKDYKRFFIGLAMVVFYGSSMKGALPTGKMLMSNIAWQAHLVGLMVGFSLAVYSRLRR